MNLESKNKKELIELVGQLQSIEQNAVVTELQNKVTELEAENEKLKAGADTSEYERQIAHLVAENTALKENKGNPNPLVEVDGEYYQPLGNILVAGKVWTPAAVVADPEFARAQVKKGNKMLQKVAVNKG